MIKAPVQGDYRGRTRLGTRITEDAAVGRFAMHGLFLAPVFVDALQALSLEIVFGDEGRYGHPPA
jgi:hypothetical protein